MLLSDLITVSNSILEELQDKLSCWLGLPDPSTNYHAALEKRHPETGFWLLNSQDFIEWKSSKCSFMWLYGNGTSQSLRMTGRTNKRHQRVVAKQF